MSDKLQIVHELDEKSWEFFVESHPHGNIFHTPDFYYIFLNTKHYDPKIWACLDSDGQILVLFLPVNISYDYPIIGKFLKRAVCYGGILFEDSPEGQHALAYLFQEYSKANRNVLLSTEIRNLVDTSNAVPIFESNGFPFDSYLNYLIALDKNPDDLLQSFGKNLRKQIRREIKHNAIRFKSIDSLEEIDTFYKLLKTTYESNRVPLADISLFQHAFKVFHDTCRIRFVNAYIEDKPVACTVELCYKDIIYGWYGGSDKTFRKYYPNEMIMWHILSIAAEEDFKYYDYGGAGYVDQEYTVRDFKAKFNGHLVNFGRHTQIHAPLPYAIAKTGYQLIQKLPHRK